MPSSTTTTSGRSEPQRPPPPTHSYIWHIFRRALEASNLTEPLLWHHHLQTVPSYHACHLGGGAALERERKKKKEKKAFKLRRPLREDWMDECDDLKRFPTNNSKCLGSFLIIHLEIYIVIINLLDFWPRIVSYSVINSAQSPNRPLSAAPIWGQEPARGPQARPVVWPGMFWAVCLNKLKA